ncbi:hypothetical protein ABK040_016461 [Willaertia magna]
MASKVSQDFYLQVTFNQSSNAAPISSSNLLMLDSVVDQQQVAAIVSNEEGNYMKVIIEKYPIKRGFNIIDQYIEGQETYIAPLVYSLPTVHDDKKKNKQVSQVVYYPIGPFIKGLQEKEQKNYTYYIKLEVCSKGNLKQMNEKIVFHSKGKDNIISGDFSYQKQQDLVLSKIHKNKIKNQVVYPLDQLKMDMKLQSNDGVPSTDTAAINTASFASTPNSTNVVDINQTSFAAIDNNDDISRYFEFDEGLLGGDGVDNNSYEKATKKPCSKLFDPAFNNTTNSNDVNNDFELLLQQLLTEQHNY